MTSQRWLWRRGCTNLMAADETELAGTDTSPLKASYAIACGTAEMRF